jgi:hypothetical protein
MLVMNVSNERVIITEYNGKRFCFYRKIPVDIPIAAYNFLVQSKHVNAQDVQPVEQKPPEPISPMELGKEEVKESIQPEVKKEAKQRGRPRK